MTVKKLLSSFEKWSRFHPGRDKFGNQIQFDSRKAVAWSLDGAIRHCYQSRKNNRVYEIEGKVYKVINSLGYSSNLSNFNDTVSFDTIKKVIDIAGI